VTGLAVSVPAFLVSPPRTEAVLLSMPVAYNPANPGMLQLGLPDTVLWVSRHGIQVGSEVPYTEQDGMRISPQQWQPDVHWTCVQFRSDERPARQLYVETWRLLEIVMRSLRLVPHGWEADFAGVADDVELDGWLRSLADAS
jgi:hypothetical protein